jgi:type VI secretion system secreted protein VgrG
MVLARVAVVKTPLGDSLLLSAMEGYEELGRPFRYELTLVTKDPDIDFSSVLGQTMTVELELHDGSTREFTGHVTEFALAGGSGRSVKYRAVLRPWLTLLSYGKNCRIFQNLTVPDVIKKIFRDQGFSDLEDRLTESYRTWEYLVQYRESDFEFVSRIMEQEGIYYYVKHAAGSHIVVLSDSRSAHEPIPGYETIPYYPPEEQRRDRDHITFWNLTRSIQPGMAAALDFNFTTPSAKLLSTRTEPDEDIGALYEEFDYPGVYVEMPEGEREVRVRLESRHAGREVATADADTRGLGVGATFTLDKFPRADQNKEHLVVSARYEIRVNADESGNFGRTDAFHMHFTAIDAARPFRAARSTRRPIVEGPQTAIVVGPAGEEIYTDEYGRVKLKFHWDRESKGDQDSSCWVRVTHVWAGTNFGGLHVPRIGQEVVVEFLEGDPDRPIITGCVYNFDNQVPFELPANMTQSGIRSRSTKGGTTSNYNELRFEDKKGSEQVSLQAEKDLNTLVKGAESRSVGGERSTNIGTDDTLTVGANRTSTITVNDQEDVGGTQTITVGSSQSVQVGGVQTILVAAARTVTSALENINAGGRAKVVLTEESTTIGASRTETVGGSESVSIVGGQTITVGGEGSLTIGQDYAVGVGGGRTQSIANDDKLTAGKRVVINAGDAIVLKAGSATLVLEKNGDIRVNGKNIKLDGSGKINVKANSTVNVKGSKITNN